MLLPKKVKYRKQHKGRRRERGQASSRIVLDFGSFGLKTLEYCWLTARQIEAARRAMLRFLAKGGKLWVRVFPDKAVTYKGPEVGMGGGKGAVDHYVAVVRPGTILFEIDGVSEENAKEAMRLAGHKLPIKTSIVSKL